MAAGSFSPKFSKLLHNWQPEVAESNSENFNTNKFCFVVSVNIFVMVFDGGAEMNLDIAPAYCLPNFPLFLFAPEGNIWLLAGKRSAVCS